MSPKVDEPTLAFGAVSCSGSRLSGAFFAASADSNYPRATSNAECYYGKVCSSYTSYALQCGIWYVSKVHGPEFRKGFTIVDPQSAQAAQPGDIIYTPPATPEASPR